MELQKRVEEIITKNLLRYKGTTSLDRAFVVMMNPKMVKFYLWQGNS